MSLRIGCVFAGWPRYVSIVSSYVRYHDPYGETRIVEWADGELQERGVSKVIQRRLVIVTQARVIAVIQSELADSTVRKEQIYMNNDEPWAIVHHGMQGITKWEVHMNRLWAPQLGSPRSLKRKYDE